MMTLSSRRSKIGVRYLLWILIIALMSFSCVPAAFSSEICGPEDLADVPLELLGGTGPPPLFMIIFNNTTSMDYEIMTGGSENGQLPNPLGGTPIGWVYNTPPLNNNSPAIENVAFYGAWKGMCYTENKMFYNPNITYTPWPHWVDAANAPAGSIDQPSGRQPDPPNATTNGINAHVNAPRTEPMDDAGTYDLTANFGAGFGVAPYINVTPPVTKSQEANGNSWVQLGPSGLSFDGVARISISQTVTCVNGNNPPGCGDADELFVGDIRLVSSNNVEYIISADDVTRTPADGWVDIYDGWLTDIKPGVFTAAWTKRGLPTNRTYTVYAKWSQNIQRSNAVTYNIQKPGPVISTVTVKRRHFYLQSANGFPYLIELLDANTAKFYKLDESLGQIPDKVEGQELTLTAWADLPADIKAVIPAPGAGAYTAHIQNFANWFSFFRTRGFAAKNAIAVTIDEMSYVMIGLLTVPPTNARECRWVDTEFDGVMQDDRSLDLINFTYMLPAPGGNPNYADAILNAGTYFEGGAGAIPSQSTTFQNALVAAGYSNTATTYPYFTSDYGGQCQHAFALMISDGGASGSSNIPNYDGDAGYPFADSHDDTMADGAMYYYENDLHPELVNDVPVNYMDQANWQHMVTYGITFGVDGQIRKNYPNCNALCVTGLCCPASWPDPWASSDPNLTAAAGLDDLYHATVNSRGVYLYASNPQELVEEMRLIKSDIERRTGAAAAVTTNSFQRQIGSTLYQGLYDSSSWFGDLLAKEVDPVTGSVGITLWSAMETLDAMTWSDRNIFTCAGGNAKNFSSSGGDIGLTADMINYLSGDRTNEGTMFRERDHVLGDIVHSQPFYHKGVLYVGANDGMMHAFDASNGKELFAYVPSMIHDNLINIALKTFIDDHLYYVDASPHAKTFGDSTYLAGGLGKGGKGVYSLNLLDVATSPTPGAADVFNWELTSASDNDMGYVYGRAYVTKTSAGPSVIFGNGYASDSGKAVLYVVNADTGAVIKKFDTSTVASASVVGCNGMSSPAIIDTDVNGVNDLVYAGDLYGNLWKFDLSGPPDSWSISNSYGGHPFFTAKDDAGNVQPITCEPDVMKHCSISREGFIVVFGTGRLLNEDDLATNVADQVFYGLYDWENDWVRASKPAADKYLGVFGSGGTLSNTTATLLRQEKTGTVSAGGEAFVITSTNPIVYFDPATETGENVGWYYVLPNSSERVVRNPTILNGIVYFVTNTTTASICSGTGTSFLYALDACSGAAPKKPQFDTDNDHDVDVNDSMNPNPSGQYYDSTLFDPVAGPGIFYINDTFGNIIQKPIPPDPQQMSYWIIQE